MSDTQKTPEALRINPDDMHDLFEAAPTGAGKDEEDPFAEMRKDPNYAALMKDLEEIAKVAKELFANADEASPSDDVWDGIAKKLAAKTDDDVQA